jgi:RNA methyltransferase, TrmH family
VVSKSQIKLIRSLEQKKYRTANNLFVAEGNKIVSDILTESFRIATLIATREFILQCRDQISSDTEVIIARAEEIRTASLLKNPQDAIAICRLPQSDAGVADQVKDWVLCLDTIQDPGNLGTIVRIADWFGIPDIVCSPETADIFNPKAVQSSMGSFCRVRVHYLALESYLSEQSSAGVLICGAFLEGDNLYAASLPKSGILVLGNEGRGIGRDILACINRKITIPSFTRSLQHAESLNVASAAAVFCSEIRRQGSGV